MVLPGPSGASAGVCLHALCCGTFYFSRSVWSVSGIQAFTLPGTVSLDNGNWTKSSTRIRHHPPGDVHGSGRNKAFDVTGPAKSFSGLAIAVYLVAARFDRRRGHRRGAVLAACRPAGLPLNVMHGLPARPATGRPQPSSQGIAHAGRIRPPGRRPAAGNPPV